MKGNAKLRTHVVMPSELIDQIDRLVGKRKRSEFLVEAAKLELMRQDQRAALREAAGAWNDEDHPELRDGVEQWVRKLRDEAEDRFRRVTDSE